MNRQLKIGIIGCGRATESLHLPALSALPGADVIAVSDIDSQRLDRIAGHYNIPHRTTDYRALLDLDEIEIVAVCVPPEHHAVIALASMHAGKHVFIEKPLALDISECRQMIEASKKTPRKTTVGFNLRHHRLVREARTLLENGAPGQIEFMRTVLTSGIRERQVLPGWRNQRSSGGGVLFELGVHHFDLWRFLLRSEVDEVFALTRSDRTDDVTAVVSASMNNGVLVNSLFCEQTTDQNEVDIFGRNGSLRLSCYRFDGLRTVASSDVPGGLSTRAKEIVHTMRSLPSAISGYINQGDFIGSYKNQWKHFVDSILNDQPPETTLTDGMRAVEIARAAVESLASKQPVKIQEHINS